MNSVTLAIIQVFVSLVIESVIFAGVFTWLQNKANEKQEQNIQKELLRLESQNHLILQALDERILKCRDDVISQIKESSRNGIR